VTDIALKNHPLVKQADAEPTRPWPGRAGGVRLVPVRQPLHRLLPQPTFLQPVGVERRLVERLRRGDLNWILYDFGRTSASVDRADANAAATRANASTTREDVVFAAKLAFYNILRAERTLSFQRENLRQRETLLRQASAFYEAASGEDRRRPRRGEPVRRPGPGEPGGKRPPRGADHPLQRMGIDGRPASRWPGAPELQLPGSMADWVAEAEKNRPELRALLEKERAATSRSGARGRTITPTSRGASGPGTGRTRSPRAELRRRVTLSLPVFSGFLTREQVKEASATVFLGPVRTHRDEAPRPLQVEASAYSVQEAQERLGPGKKEREASEENLRLATARYEVGAGTSSR